MTTDPGWVRDHSELRISGWVLAEVDLGSGWQGVATCPICYAMVMNDYRTNGVSWQVRAHEQWHAKNDLPIPAELAAPN